MKTWVYILRYIPVFLLVGIAVWTAYNLIDFGGKTGAIVSLGVAMYWVLNTMIPLVLENGKDE